MEEKKKIKKPMPPVLDNLTRYNDMKIEQELESKSSERLDTLRYNHLLSKTNQSFNGEELTYDDENQLTASIIGEGNAS